MALAALSEDEQRIVFSQLCNVLDPRVAVALSSAGREFRAPMQVLLQQRRACSSVVPPGYADLV